MRIHRVRLADYRGVQGCEVAFATDGVTVVEGPNEGGKSSIAEAIQLVLSERHDTTKRAVRSIQPVGRDVGTEVEIELTIGPYHLVCTKRWFSRPSTELRVLEPAPEQLSGREAHDRLRSILDEHLDDALWRALQVEQGEKLTQATFEGGSLGRALDVASGGSGADGVHDDLFERIVAERAKYWTATGKLLREHTELRDARERASALVAELTGSIDELAADALTVERLARELEEKQCARSSQRERLAEYRERSKRIEAQVASIQRLEGAHREALAGAQLAADRSKARRRMLEAVETLAGDLRLQRERLEDRRSAGEQLDRARSEALATFDEAKQAASAAEAAHLGALADAAHLSDAEQLQRDRERLERARAALGAKQAAARELEDNPVTSEIFEQVEEAHLRVLGATSRLEAGAATVHLEALTELVVDVDGSEQSLARGGSLELQVAGTKRIEVPGSLALTVSSGGNAELLADRLREAEAQLRSLCDHYGLEDRSDAARSRDARQESQRRFDEADGSLAAELSGATPEELEAQVEHLVERVDAFLAGRSAHEPLPADRAAADALVSERLEALGAARAELAAADAQREVAAEAFSAHREDLLLTADAEQRLTGELASAEQSLATARAESTDADLEDSRRQADTAVEDARGSLDAARAELESCDPESIGLELANAEQLEKRVEDEVNDLEGKLRDLRTRIELRGGDGLAARLDEALTDEAHLAGRWERLMERAEAAALLHESFRTRREDAHERYVAPFRERIEQLGRLLHGPGFEVTIGSDLDIRSRTLDGATLRFEQLSIGAQEQLGMISRLAAASIASSDGGAPVILDDVLGWTDPDRLERMGLVIASAGTDCQVIAFTCTPGRFENVGRATVVKL